MGKLLLSAASGVLFLSVFLGVLMYNANNNQSNQLKTTVKKLSHPSLSTTQLAERLSRAIQFKTISESQEEIINYKPVFLELHQYMEELFPLTHSSLELKKMGIDELSLLYIWKGKNHGTGNDKAIILSSHLDVVPVPSDTLQFWTHEPFSGTIEDGFIWVFILFMNFGHYLREERDEVHWTINKEYLLFWKPLNGFCPPIINLPTPFI